MNRKEFLKYSGNLSALLMSGGVISFLESCKKENMTMKSLTVKSGTFETEMILPSVMSATNVSLSAKRNLFSVVNGKKAQVYGYTDGILAPILKATNGQSISINVKNNIEEITNVHWHGLIIPENMDGHPQYTIPPGGSYNYQFSINQRAGTYWFHPHPHLYTGRQVNKGLAGMFLITDSEEAALNLPTGEFELPIIIQDKRILSDGSINYNPDDMDVMNGYLGDYVCVNGQWSVFHNVKTKTYRLRILNGSNARTYNLGFTNGINFNIIGTDGGLLGSTLSTNSIILSPGERMDVLVDFSALNVGNEFYLQSNSFNGNEVQGNDSFNILKFIVSEKVNESFVIPSALSSYVSIPASQSVKTRSFEIANNHAGGHRGMNMGSSSSIHKIGGKSFVMDRIDETVNAGSTEIWEFDNSQGEDLHPMHLHGVHFQILSRIGGRGNIFPHEMGWKDTVLCMPGEKVKVIMTFPNNLGKFAFHCHNLEHEDSGMMLNFKIV